MKKYLILFGLILINSSTIYSQNIFDNITFSRNYKLIQKGDLKKAFQKIEKEITKEKDLLRNKYAISLIYSNRNFKKYDPKKSYEFLLESQNTFRNINDEKIIKKLNDIPINDSIYSFEFSKICSLALEDAILLNQIDSYEEYLSFYKKSSNENQEIAIKKRNIVAFNAAVILHTIDSYKNFINKYPQAEQIKKAWEQIYIIAFDEASNINTINSYEKFIVEYPKAPQQTEATKRIHDIAFVKAKEVNTSQSYIDFCNSYPESSQYDYAYQLYEQFQFLENTQIGVWESYDDFIRNYSANSNTKQAQDSILSLGIRYDNINALENYIDNGYEFKREALKKLYPLFTMDGEEETINLFIDKYGHVSELYYDIETDLEIARKSKSLLLNLPFDKSKENEYNEFIINSAPSEISFVALQRLLSYNLKRKRFSSALSILNRFDTLFVDYPNFYNLKKILEENYDKSIVAKSVGSKINSSVGEEYGPVITADNKQLFFCGNNRKDNIGGEDIYISKSRRGSWRTPRIVDELSTQNFNEATVNISSDGTTLILFREGKLLISEKDYTGWSKPVELPKTINSGIWNSDATISSNGEALIFASVRENSNNLFQNNTNNYHGDNQYPSDIYISLRDQDDNWGEPINIGDSINTRFTERSPFLHPDMKTLYFSSDGHGGLGKLDVFMSTRLYDTCWTCWSKPVNLGKEINTIESDWGYKISTDGKTAFFTKENNSFKRNSLLLLLDVSGSMAGEKIISLKEAAKDVCRNAINNNSKVSIMAFDGDCTFPIDTVLSFTDNINDIDNYINSLTADGGTPMYEAYVIASEYINDFAESNSNKMILLMSDGDANGCRNLDESLEVINRNRNKVQTQTIAFMVDSNSLAYSDLKTIAEYSNGELHYVQNTSSLKSSFSKATSSLYGINTTSTRKDIYTLNLPDHLRPDLVATVEGRLLDSKKNPIDASIRFEDLESNKLIGKIKNNPEDGSYFIVLPLGKLYGLYIDKDDYFPISNNLDLRNEDKIVEIENNIPLYTFEEMINEGIAVPINNIFFDSGLTELKDYSIPELKRIAKIIIENNLRVELSGHTDNVDTEEYNLKLSKERAEAVKDYLLTLGCSDDKIITIGFGESMPLNSNSNSQERKINRRVEFKFID